MEFYQTNGGKRFFEVQLPKLIRALEDMTEALNRKQAPVVLPAGGRRFPERALLWKCRHWSGFYRRL